MHYAHWPWALFNGYHSCKNCYMNTATLSLVTKVMCTQSCCRKSSFMCREWPSSHVWSVKRDSNLVINRTVSDHFTKYQITSSTVTGENARTTLSACSRRLTPMEGRVITQHRFSNVCNINIFFFLNWETTVIPYLFYYNDIIIAAIPKEISDPRILITDMLSYFMLILGLT